jgi:hypothetical protein
MVCCCGYKEGVDWIKADKRNLAAVVVHPLKQLVCSPSFVRVFLGSGEQLVSCFGQQQYTYTKEYYKSFKGSKYCTAAATLKRLSPQSRPPFALNQISVA